MPPTSLGCPIWLADAGNTLAALAQPLFGAPQIAAAQGAAPGGVTTNLKLWLKADAGIGSADGAVVTAWNDQTGGGYNLAQATAAYQPLYYSATTGQLVNFNPSVHFDGSNDFIANSTRLMPATSPYTLLVLGQDEDTATGYNKLVSSEETFDVFGLYKQGGAAGDNGWIPYGVSGAPDRGDMGKGTKYSANGGANGFWNGTNFTSDARTDHAQPQIVGFMSANSATTDAMFTWVDGYKEDPGWSFINQNVVYQPRFFARYALGADYNGTSGVETWKGKINEAVVYDRVLSDAEMAQVNTYLAIKWGVTLGQGNGSVGVNGGNYNYVASDSAVIWNAAANTAYGNDIAGIGRDDASALTQKQSKSVNNDAMVTIGLGAIATSNAANANNFAADKSFLLWGNDNGATGFATVQPAIGGLPTVRTTRIWKVQETGTIGNVEVQGPTNATHLLVDADGDFSAGATAIALSGGKFIVDFTSGQFFTFARAQGVPGGVAVNLKAWYDAAQGVTQAGGLVSNWDDSSGNGHLTGQTAANRQPTFRSGAQGINFNPALDFQPAGTTVQDMLSILEPDATNNLMFQPSDDGTVIAAGDNTDVASPHSTLIGWGTDANSPQLAVSSSKMQIWNNGSSPVWTPGSSNAAAAQAVANNQPYVFGWQWLNEAGGANRGMDTRLNGNGVHYPDMEGSNIQNYVNHEMHIGWNDCCSEDWTGRISEIVVYSQKLDGADLQKVDSYFALKYGVTLDPAADDDPTVEDGDYVDSSGGVYWDYSANTPYHNDVAGIGRDDAGVLNQKQSKSVNSDAIVTMGLGAIAVDNAANANAFAADKSFLLWGNNNGGASFSVPYTPDSFTPTTPYYRMGRIWKVQETGTVGAVQVAVNAGASHLIVDTDGDGDFSTGTQQEIALSGGAGSFNFASGNFFTFAAAQTAPGGVTANLAAWYKAGSTVGATQWNDESGNDKHMLAAGTGTAASMPTLDATPGATNNFNPRVAFLSNADGSRKWTMIASGNDVFANTSTNGTIFNVSSFPDQTVYDVPQVYAFEDDDPGLNFVTDRNANNDIRVIFQRDNGGTGTASWDFAVPGVSQTQPLLTAHAWNYAAGGNTFTFNGYDYTPATNSFIGAMSTRYMFGAELTNGSGEAHSGYTSENIVYATDWPSNSDERKRINSYLAIKYGITLLGTGTLGGGTADATFGGTADYLNSASAVIWNGTTTNSSYHNDVAGIGRDDASALNQKQSKSVNSDALVTIGLGTIAASNAANASAFPADKNFLVWGNDNGATTDTETANVPATVTRRLVRKWKVAETGGDVGTVSLAFDINSLTLTGGDTTLLIDTDGDGNFTTGVVTIVPASSFSGGVATFSSVNLATGDIFTLATEADSDGDGVPDNVEVSQGTEPQRPIELSGHRRRRRARLCRDAGRHRPQRRQ